jgi:hypothetical protein
MDIEITSQKVMDLCLLRAERLTSSHMSYQNRGRGMVINMLWSPMTTGMSPSGFIELFMRRRRTRRRKRKVISMYDT